LKKAYAKKATAEPSVKTSTTSSAESVTTSTSTTTTSAATNTSSSASTLSGSTTRSKSRYVQPSSAPTTTRTIVENVTETDVAETVAPKVVEKTVTRVIPTPAPKPAPVKPVVTTTAAVTPEVAPEVKPVAKPEVTAAAKRAVIEAAKSRLAIPTATESTVASKPATETLPLAKTEDIPESKPAAELAAAEPAKPATEAASSILTSSPEASGAPTSLSNALRLPTAVRPSSQEFNYITILPVSYDFGGGGLQIGGSTNPHGKAQVFFRAGLAETYQEAMVGASYFITPTRADRLTFVLSGGAEYGNFLFEEQDIEATESDSGVFARATTRLVMNNRVELQGGLGYSSFFNGDPHAFGGVLFHLTDKMDLTGEFELGDNDSLGLGFRFYY